MNYLWKSAIYLDLFEFWELKSTNAGIGAFNLVVHLYIIMNLKYSVLLFRSMLLFWYPDNPPPEKFSYRHLSIPDKYPPVYIH